MSPSKVSKITVCAAAVVLAALACLPASAALTQIMTPDAAYTSSTALLPIVGSEYSDVSALTDGSLTATFDAPQNIRVVGSSWATWGAPPDTENATPTILYTSGPSSLAIAFSTAISTFGLEAEGEPFDVRTFTMDFYSGASLLGSISRDIDGYSGARLLAASSDTMFDSVVVSTDVDFSTAQLRYAAVPEPSSLIALLSGVGGLGGLILRKRS